MGVRGGRGSYTSIHLPNSTAALPLYQITGCCKYSLGGEREWVCRDNIRYLYTKTHTTETETSTDMKEFPFFIKHYHCTNDSHVEMLITEEQGGSGWNAKSVTCYTQYNKLGFTWNYYWNLDWVAVLLSVCCGWMTIVHHSIAECFVFILRQYEIWTTLAVMKWQSIQLIPNQLLKDFLPLVDMFFFI